MGRKREFSNLAELTIRTLLISIRSCKRERYKLCDGIIIPNLKGYSFLNYKKVEDYAEKGYRAAEEFFNGRAL